MLGDDKSDIAKGCRLTCEAANPDPETKALIWSQLVDPKSSFSLYERRSKMEGFYSWDQLDILDEYFDKFYE